jgi:hypothetical protein
LQSSRCLILWHASKLWVLGDRDYPASKYGRENQRTTRIFRRVLAVVGRWSIAKGTQDGELTARTAIDWRSMEISAWGEGGGKAGSLEIHAVGLGERFDCDSAVPAMFELRRLSISVATMDVVAVRLL